MEVEDEDAVLQRLFFKKFGRALPEPEKEKEKEKENEVDKINFVIDLTDEDEMEVATSENVPPVPVVKTEPIEAAEATVVNVVNVADVNVADVANRRSFRLERLELAKARKAITEFGKSLRKKEVIPEKEAPLAAGTEDVIADNDLDMAEDTSVGSVNTVELVNSVETVNTESGNNVVEPLTADEAFEMAEKAIAESDAAIAANQKVIDKFYDV
jgi:hypothetical protein